MQFFVGVNSHGVLDEDGQVLDVGTMDDGSEDDWLFGDHGSTLDDQEDIQDVFLVAEEDKPLEMVAHILEAWSPMWRYSTAEAAQADLEFFRDFVASFDFEREGPRPRWEWN
jgi:hypothetical protein